MKVWEAIQKLEKMPENFDVQLTEVGIEQVNRTMALVRRPMYYIFHREDETKEWNEEYDVPFGRGESDAGARDYMQQILEQDFGFTEEKSIDIASKIMIHEDYPPGEGEFK